MKSLFIGLLVVAAGTAVYFFVIKKKKEEPVTSGINKELLIGKWKTDLSSGVADSAKVPFTWDFQKEGIALRSVSDTIKADTLHYAWKETGELLLKQKAADSTGTVFTVSRLTADSLEVKGTDNVALLFSRVK